MINIVYETELTSRLVENAPTYDGRCKMGDVSFTNSLEVFEIVAVL